ncbi:hypothetical protein HDU97_009872 [Phlyctochytrium planicorne]|nr:hypothetical protein HDU97_009872 [Phlyctochytrium planicorne]
MAPGRSKLLILSLVILGIIYLSFLNLSSPTAPIKKPSSSVTDHQTTGGSKKNPVKNNPPAPAPAAGAEKGIPKKKVSDSTSNVSKHKLDLGAPLFDLPNTTFDQVVERLIQDNNNPRDGKDAVKKYDKFAVALKTGAEVAVQRASIHLVTFLKKIRNLVVIGESPGVHIGDIPMVDVYTGVYDLVDKRLAAQKEKDEVEKKERKKSGVKKEKEAEKKEDEEIEDPRLEKRADAVVPAEDSRGWKLDAHKNIPGMAYLYHKYPKADWYIMIDDDSYVFFDNLDNYLSGKDPAKPHYIGQSNVFVGCDGVKSFGEGPYFAHGGSGIVVSRGAVEKMMGNLENCIAKYRDCWAGDVRLALCLRDVGIKLTGGEGFDKEPETHSYFYGRFLGNHKTISPNDDQWMSPDGCFRPNVYHHLLPHQIQKLHEIETLSMMSHPEHGTTHADVFQHFTTDRKPIEKDTDRPGNDMRNASVDNAEACEKMCREEKKCLSWSFANGKCYIKDKITQIKTGDEYKGRASGVIPERYVCKKIKSMYGADA